MTATEIIVILVCLPLGYWIMAVFVPSLMESDGGEEADVASHTVKNASATTEAQWFEVLEVDENCPREDITAAYRRLIRQYHPDLVAQMGADLRALAERRSVQINAAYATALRLRSAGIEV